MKPNNLPRAVVKAAHEAAEKGVGRVLDAISVWQDTHPQEALEHDLKKLLLEIALDGILLSRRP